MVASLIIVALGLSAVSGVTYSWWSDSEDTSISVTTGYVHVETSGLSVEKGGVTVSGASGSMPDGIEIVYSDEGGTTWTTDDEGTKFIITGDPDESIVINYTVEFSWTVEAKYIMGFGSSSDDLRDATSIEITQNGVAVRPNERGWFEPNEGSGTEKYNVKLTLNSLPPGIKGADLIVKNYITQCASDVDVWDGTTADVVVPENGVYEIYSADQLSWVAKQVNDSKDTFEGETVKLMNDIDLGGILWTPIGCYQDNGSQTFLGSFQGNGKTIRNLNVETPMGVSENASSGLFGYVGCSGTLIEDLTIDGAMIKGQKNLGGIAGCLQFGTISDCIVKNTVITNISESASRDGDKTGGIVGMLCSNPGAVVEGCVVENITLTGVRDIGCIAGMVYDFNSFEGNRIKGDNKIIISGESNDGLNKVNAKPIVGRHIGSGVLVESNKVVEGATVDIKYSVKAVDDLKYVFNNWESLGMKDIPVSIDAKLEMDESWESIEITNSGLDAQQLTGELVVIKGNGYEISGLTDALIKNVYGVKVEISDLKITGASVSSGIDDLGAGILIHTAGWSDVSISGCSIVDSELDTGELDVRVGALIGHFSTSGTGEGYKLSISSCIIENVNLKAEGSVGGVIGQLQVGTVDSASIENVRVSSCIFVSTDDGAWRVGGFIGTLDGGGIVTVDGCQMNAVTLTQESGTSTGVDQFGRIYNNNGKIIIDGVSYPDA